ncbi:hypothetical protein Tco_0995183 [Tanacetum coccineum]
MTKVIKGEFEKIKGVKVEDVLLTCNTPLEVFNNEVNRLSRIDEDLFTYEVEVANILCDSKMDDDLEHEADDDMGYDLSDVAFTEWLGSKNFNYKTMDHYTMKALWIYWIKGDDETYDDTRMIGSMNGTRTYHGSMRSHGLTLKFRPNPHRLNILASLSTIRLDVWNDQHVVGRIMDTVMEETYPELTLLETDSIIKIRMINHKDNEKEELCEVHELPVCNIRRYMMTKYSFNNDEEYVAVKEDEYGDPTITREEACRAYQEIFQKLNEGWMVT